MTQYKQANAGPNAPRKGKVLTLWLRSPAGLGPSDLYRGVSLVTWVKIDDHMADHPKVSGLGVYAPFAIALQVRALCYSARYLTDGHIPEGITGQLCQGFSSWKNGVKRVDWPGVMVKAKLWERITDGYKIHDYLEYNPSREDTISEREAVKERVRRHREARVTGTVTALQTREKPVSTTCPSPSPSPSPDIGVDSSIGALDSNTATAAPKAAPSKKYDEHIGLARVHLWPPDGKPPIGSTVARECTVLRELLARNFTHAELSLAIEGLGYLRRGLCDPELRAEWLEGKKVSLRVLFKAKSGLLSIRDLAEKAYWFNTGKRAKPSNVPGLDALATLERLG